MSNDNLKTLLRMCVAGPAERKQLSEMLPKKMRAYQDGKVYEIDNVREFILSTDLEGSGLVQYEIDATVKKGAVKAKCVREALPILRMNTDTMRVPYGNGEQSPPTVKEGAEFPAMYQDYAYVTLEAVKRGWHVPVSEELIMDGKFDIIAIELEKAGRNLEYQLNEMVISAMLDAAGNEHDCTGSNLGVKAVVGAKTLVDADGFNADKGILHPQAYGQVFSDFVPSYNAQAQGILESGKLPMIAGVTPYVCSVPDVSSTYTWGYAADGNIGMLVFDSGNAGFIGIREDVTIKAFEQPLKMLQSPIVYARWDFATLHADAISRVEY